jgi:hypothetical protein
VGAGAFWLRADDGGASSPTPTASATGGAPSAGGSPTAADPSAARTNPATGTDRAVAVYYIADAANGPRLYREFHRLTVPGDGAAGTATIRVALAEMFAGRADDPDYTSPWPTDTSVRSVSVSGDLATVDVSGFVSVGASFETAAVQQLVYTVTAADPSVRRVRLLVDGAVPPSGHSDWSVPIARAPALDVQAFVWILTPTEGAETTSPVRISVYGTGFEGTVPLKVFRGETEVASTFVTTMMGGFREADTTIALPPGEYELRAYNDSGRDASLQLWDTKTFTVTR